MSESRRWGVGWNQHRKRPGTQPAGTPPDRAVLDGVRSRLDPGLVASRAALLDALDALKPHLDSLVVIGAHAVYELSVDSGVPPTATVDAHALVVSELLTGDLSIETAMSEAGFRLKDNARPGIYEHAYSDATVDLLCAEALAGAGRSGARIAGQSKHAVGRAAGLELALVDHERRSLSALDNSERAVQVNVAGPSAMLCAKAHKLADRYRDMTARGRPDRLRPKDAVDVWRLMRVIDPVTARTTFDRHADDATIGPAIAAGREHLIALFSNGSPIVQLVVNDTADTGTAPFIDQWIGRFR